MGVRDVEEFTESLDLFFGGQPSDVSDDPLTVRSMGVSKCECLVGESVVGVKPVEVYATPPQRKVCDAEFLQGVTRNRCWCKSHRRRVVGVRHESVDHRFGYGHSVSVKVSGDVGLVHGNGCNRVSLRVGNRLGTQRERTRHVNEVGADSVEKIRHCDAGNSDGKFDERNAGDDVDGDAFKLRPQSCRGNNRHVVTQIALVARDANHRIGHAVELG